MTSEELAHLLMTVRVRDVSERSGVSEKTIYRLRHRVNEPNLATVRKLVEAIKAMKKRRA